MRSPLYLWKPLLVFMALAPSVFAIGSDAAASARADAAAASTGSAAGTAGSAAAGTATGATDAAKKEEEGCSGEPKSEGEAKQKDAEAGNNACMVKWWNLNGKEEEAAKAAADSASASAGNTQQGPWNAENAKALIAQQDPQAAANMSQANLDNAAGQLNAQYAQNPTDPRNTPEGFGLQSASSTPQASAGQVATGQGAATDAFSQSPAATSADYSSAAGSAGSLGSVQDSMKQANYSLEGSYSNTPISAPPETAGVTTDAAGLAVPKAESSAVADFSGWQGLDNYAKTTPATGAQAVASQADVANASAVVGNMNQLQQGSNVISAAPDEVIASAKANNINGVGLTEPGAALQQSQQLNNGATFDSSAATKQDYAAAGGIGNATASASPVAQWQTSEDLGKNVQIGGDSMTAAEVAAAAKGGQNINGVSSVTDPVAAWNAPKYAEGTIQDATGTKPVATPSKGGGGGGGGGGAGTAATAAAANPMNALLQNPALAMAAGSVVAGLMNKNGKSGSSSSAAALAAASDKNAAATKADSKGCYYTMGGSHVCPASKTTTVTSSCFTSGTKTMCPVTTADTQATTTASFRSGYAAGMAGSSPDPDHIDDADYMNAYNQAVKEKATSTTGSTQ